MANFPFGFGGIDAMTSGPRQMATADQKKGKPTRQLRKMVEYGMQNNGLGSGMGAVMGFMGLPFLTRQWGGHGSSGPWQTVNPWDALGSPYAFGGGGSGGGGGDDGSGGGDGGGDGSGGNGDGDGNGYNDLLKLLYPPPIGTGAQWRNTMKYGA